jgi:histidine phosphotransferase ChpT
MDDDSDMVFAALLCSRLCHDLVSPVGAITNGIELLAEEDDPEMISQVMDLLRQSASQTSNRLQFFRLAFGVAGGFGSSIDLREAHKSLSLFFSDNQVELDWDAESKLIRKDFVKILLIMSMIAGDGLIRGGVVKVDLNTENGPITLSVVAEGPRFIMQEVFQKALCGELPSSELEPRTSPAFLAGKIAKKLGTKIKVNGIEETGINLSVDFPNS